MEQPNTRYYRFEGFLLDTQARELCDGQGEAVPLNARAFDALWLLLRHRDRVVGKDELLELVWAGRVVEENTLTQAISGLRRALGAGAGDHRYIVTVPGRGYRFVADVEDGDPALLRQRSAGELEVAVDAAGDSLHTDPALREPLAMPAMPPEVVPPRFDPRWRGGAVLLVVGVAIGLALWLRPATPPATTATPLAAAPVTLAVLPFRSLSPATRDEQLELGLAETLITRLSRAPSLHVPALTSTQRLANPGQAARLLGARYVVEGTTQQAGDQVRVNARLLAADTGKVLWAETIDARNDRVFLLQDRIGDAVTTALSLPAVVAPSRADSPCDGADVFAYRAYLRGAYQIHRPNAERLTLALAAFREAIDRDPTCTRAWVGTAFAYRSLVITADRDPRELFPLAKAAVARALAVNPDSAEAYASKGFIEFWYDWDWARAEASMRKAIALNPNLAEAHLALAHLLVNIGRAEEAAPHARRAIALDPLSPLVNSLAGSFLGAAGHQAEAQRQIDRTLELEPDSWIAMRIRSGHWKRQGDHRRSLAELQRALEVSGGSSQILNLLGDAYVAVGDRAAAQGIAAGLEQRRRDAYAPASSLARVYVALGENERAMDLLEQGYRERDVRLSFLRIDNWGSLRNTSRFQALLRRMGLAGGEDKPDG